MSELNMEPITLEKSNLIINSAIEKAREIKINPIMVVVLDHRGAIKACSGEDGVSSLRFKIAHGKANGAFQMGMGSRALFNRSLGISGDTSDNDEIAAVAGIEAAGFTADIG